MNTFSFKIQNIKNECQRLLPLGCSVAFQGAGSVISHVVKDLHDGTTQTIAIIDPQVSEVQEFMFGGSPAKEVFKGELKKSSQSKKIRDRLYILWTELGAKGEFETYYKIETDKLIDAVDETIDRVKMEGLV
jgi:hypothetical protein